MFRPLRHRLRLIRYYSAARRRTRWSTATDIALIGAVVLAPLCMWLTHVTVVRTQIAAEVFGRTMQQYDGRMRAEILLQKQLVSPWPAGVTPLSEFHLYVQHEDHGWPVTTGRVTKPPKLDLTLIVERTTTENVPFDSDDAELAAIDSILRDKEHASLTDRWQAASSESDTLVLGWIFGSVLWCVMLWILAIVGINLTRLAALVFLAKRQVRGAKLRKSNRCPHCGYDLRGLEFRDRCPECGELSW